MNPGKRTQLVKDIQELQRQVEQFTRIIAQGKDIDKAKALSLSISGLATSNQLALSDETSL